MEYRNRRYAVALDVWKLTFEIGWFKGEPFRLFQTTILDVVGSDCVAILDIQIVKFAIAITYSDM